jgi:hypothetical protein
MSGFKIHAGAAAFGTRNAFSSARSFVLLLLILLIALLIGTTPAWPYSRGWGYYPSGVLGTVLLACLAMVLLDQVTL